MRRLTGITALEGGFAICGICGYYNVVRAQESLPLDKLQHRGPDGQGEIAGDRFRFGHTRLAIIDVDNGEQPMFNEDGTVCLTFNGEIYNYQTLRDDLANRHQFKTDTDTEVILHLFEEEGIDGLKKLDGMFALAIQSGDLFVLARDPLGIKPLYTCKKDGAIYFSSELKTFEERLLPFVKEFPPGHIFTNRSGYQKYYQLPRGFRRDLDWHEGLTELRTRLYRAVEKRLMSDVPLGSFLSGGLDSSLISALIKEGKEELHTFSIALAESNDRYYSGLVSRHLGTIHHEYILKPEEMWEALPEIIYYLESFDRSLVRSAVANYFLAKITSDYVKVVLTGEGADELFAGYEYLAEFSEWDDLHQELYEITGELHNTNLQRVDRMTMAHGLEARVPFLDTEVIDWGLGMPPWFKREQKQKIGKWCLREAFRDQGLIPEEVIDREKEKFAEGTGVADILEQLADERVPDSDFQREVKAGTPLRSKEEYHYFQIYSSFFGRENALRLVGRSRS